MDRRINNIFFFHVSAPTKSGDSDTEEIGAKNESGILGQQGSSKSETDRHYFLANSDFYATKGLDLCSILLGCDPNESEASSNNITTTNSDGAVSSQFISASALGLKSVLDNFPSLGFGKKDEKLDEECGSQLNMNPTSINVIKFDARSECTGSKAALVAIAQDFFALEADEKPENSRNKYKTAMDELLDDFNFVEED